MEELDLAQWREASRQVQQTGGRVSASVTHEIKNHLAVVKEMASLLQDLSLAAGAKGALDPEKVQSLSGRMVERVRQADQVVKRFNTFSHAVDKPLASRDLAESLILMVEMYRRLADMKEVALNVENIETGKSIITRPDFLLTAIFACLDAAANAAPAGSGINIRLDSAQKEARIVFDFAGGRIGDDGPSPSLLAALGATLLEADEGGGLTLVLPQQALESSL